MNKRILPYNIDAERSVLGAVMLNRRALMDVLEIVKLEDFYDPIVRHVAKRDIRRFELCWIITLMTRKVQFSR
jgi:hypothetical protein